MNSRWIVRFAAIAVFVALTLCLATSSLADLSGDGQPTLSTGQPEVQSFGPPPRLQFDANRRGDDIVRTMLTDRAMGQRDGSPSLPPGQGGMIPGRPLDRPVGGNPDPGTPPGRPDNRPPAHSNAGGNDGGDDEGEEAERDGDGKGKGKGKDKD
jgi:hypothetical protein